MTDPGDYGSEMERNRKITPDEAEALLAGRTPAGTADLDELAGFLRSAKAVAHEAPDAATQTQHLAAIADAVSTLTQPIAAGTIAPPSRSRTMLNSRWFKVAAGAVAAVLATGGLAAAHTLPAPAQDAVAAVADRVGINLPTSHDDEDAAEEAAEEAARVKKAKKAKDGFDHDGDGVADDNGNHFGQLKHASPSPTASSDVEDERGHSGRNHPEDDRSDRADERNQGDAHTNRDHSPKPSASPDTDGSDSDDNGRSGSSNRGGNSGSGSKGKSGDHRQDDND